MMVWTCPTKADRIIVDGKN